MKRKIFSIFFALVLALSLSLVTAVPAGAQEPPDDWPMFNRDLLNTGVADPTLAGISSPAQLWTFDNDNLIGSGSPVIADIDGDGVPEVLIGTANFDNTGGIYALDGQTGTQKWKYETGDKGTYATPPLADIDGDGKLETIFPSYTGKIVAVDDDGTEIWSVDKGSGGTRSVIADVTGDSALEVVAGAASKTFLLKASDGTQLWEADYRMLCDPAVADVDGDGKLEIVFSAYGKFVVALNAEDGTTAWESTLMGQDSQNSLAIISDINDDGKPDVVTGNRDPNSLYVFSGADGTQIWSYPVVGRCFSAAVADFNGDGYDDVVTTAGLGTPESYAYLLDVKNQTLLWQHDIVGKSGYTTERSPSIADVNGDGTPDVLISGLSQKLYALSGVDGSEIWTIDTDDPSAGVPAIADLNGDGVMDIVVAAGNTVFAVTQAPSEVWVDDDFTQGACGGNIWQYDAFATIQEGIDAVVGSTVNVAAGEYGPFTVDTKTNLTIQSDGVVTVQGVQVVTIAPSGERDVVVFVKDSTNIVLDGLTVGPNTGKTQAKDYGVVYENSSGEINGCTVSPDTSEDMYSTAIAMWNGSDITIDNCTIHNFGRLGVFIYNGCSARVLDSTIIGQVYTEEAKVCYGIEVEGAYMDDDPDTASQVTIRGNEIYNCDNTFLTAPTWGSSALLINGWLEYYPAADSTVILEKNNIHDNYAGIYVIKSPSSYAHTNNIYDNRTFGVESAAAHDKTTAVFDATNNWWSNASGPTHEGSPFGIGDVVSDLVTYNPWLLAVVVPEDEPTTYEKTLALQDGWTLISVDKALASSAWVGTAPFDGGEATISAFKYDLIEGTVGYGEATTADLEPLTAIYVQTDGGGGVGFNYAEDDDPAFYPKDLEAGWNLISTTSSDITASALLSGLRYTTVGTQQWVGLTTLVSQVYYNQFSSDFYLATLTDADWDALDGAALLCPFDGYWADMEAADTFEVR